MLLRRCVLLVMFGYSDSRKEVSKIALFQNVRTLENFTSCTKEVGQDEEKDEGVLEGEKGPADNSRKESRRRVAWCSKGSSQARFV